jgi:hypothetical protein
MARRRPRSRFDAMNDSQRTNMRESAIKIVHDDERKRTQQKQALVTKQRHNADAIQEGNRMKRESPGSYGDGTMILLKNLASTTMAKRGRDRFGNGIVPGRNASRSGNLFGRGAAHPPGNTQGMQNPTHTGPRQKPMIYAERLPIGRRGGRRRLF